MFVFNSKLSRKLLSIPIIKCTFLCYLPTNRNLHPYLNVSSHDPLNEQTV